MYKNYVIGIMELKGENHFRIEATRNGKRIIKLKIIIVQGSISSVQNYDV